MPVRIQRRRTKGWKMPANTVFVGRPSSWGNPFVIGRDGDAATCVRKYSHLHLPYRHHGPNNSLKDFFISEANITAMVNELAGKNLACWCPIECTDCGGSGQRYSAILQEIHPITPPIINNICSTCGGLGRQPCHADFLLEIANIHMEE